MVDVHADNGGQTATWCVFQGDVAAHGSRRSLGPGGSETDSVGFGSGCVTEAVEGGEDFVLPVRDSPPTVDDPYAETAADNSTGRAIAPGVLPRVATGVNADRPPGERPTSALAITLARDQRVNRPQ
jgi:hypothetical protein